MKYWTVADAHGTSGAQMAHVVNDAGNFIGSRLPCTWNRVAGVDGCYFTSIIFTDVSTRQQWFNSNYAVSRIVSCQYAIYLI